MKKLILFFGIFFFSYTMNANTTSQYNYSRAYKYFPQFRLTSRHFGIFMTTRDFDKPQYSVRGGSFDDGIFIMREHYFQPYFGSVYEDFSMLRYEFPKANVFCRMESHTCNKYNVMFSIHAGGYSER